MPIIIDIKDGIYKENLHHDSAKDSVTIIGENKFKTCLTYGDHAGGAIGTKQKIIKQHDMLNMKIMVLMLQYP